MTTVKTYTWLLLGILFAAFHAGADTVVTPASPTSVDTIHARIEYAAMGCFTTVSTSIVGNAIRTDITLTGCTVGSGSFQNFEYATLGPLAAGTYMYDVYAGYGTDPAGNIYHSHQTIVVTPSLPTLNDIGLGILGISLVAVAWLMVGKRGIAS